MSIDDWAKGSEVAVTVMEVWVDAVRFVPGMRVDPHPPRENRPTAANMIQKDCGRRLPSPKTQHASATPVMGTKSTGAWELPDVSGATATVRIVAADAAPGFTVEGEKLQEALEGSPPQVKVTFWLKPLTGVIIKLAVAECPRVTLKDAGESETVNAGAPMMYVDEDTALELAASCEPPGVD